MNSSPPNKFTVAEYCEKFKLPIKNCYTAPTRAAEQRLESSSSRIAHKASGVGAIMNMFANIKNRPLGKWAKFIIWAVILFIFLRSMIISNPTPTNLTNSVSGSSTRPDSFDLIKLLTDSRLAPIKGDNSSTKLLVPVNNQTSSNGV